MNTHVAVTSTNAASPVETTAIRGFGGADKPDMPFSGLFKGALDSVNALDGRAQATVEGLMTGSGVDVHEAMIAAQKASMAFELVLAVRNKAVQAYQNVMSMQF